MSSEEILTKLKELADYGWSIHPSLLNGDLYSFSAFMTLLREIDYIIKQIKEAE